MNTKKVLFTGAAILSGLAMVGTVAFAQMAANKNLSIDGSGSVKLTGTVSAVSGTNLSVNTWGGTWQVTNANTTDIQVGDIVKVNGTVASGMTIGAKKVVEIPSQPIKKLSGTVSNLNTAAGTFTLTTEHNGVVTVTTNSSTQIFLNGGVSALSSLSNGGTASVSGSMSSTNAMTASFVIVPKIEKHGKVMDALLKLHGWGWFRNK